MQLCAGLGSSMRVREVVTAVTRGVLQVRLSEAERRWPVGERLRDGAEEARGASEASDPCSPSAVAVAFPVAGFAGFADIANFAERASFAMRARRAQSA